METITPSPMSDIDKQIQRELESITIDQTKNRVLTLEHLGTLAPQTRLVLLLDAAAHSVFLPRAVFNHLKKEFYSDFDGKRGGLTLAAFDKYARDCKTVAEAAQRHRDFVTGDKR